MLPVSYLAAPFTAEFVAARLDEAGATLMALPGRGCFPSPIRSGMPEYIQIATPDEPVHLERALHSASSAERPRPAIPGSRAITEMEEAYAWVGVLPWQTDLQRQMRRLVHLRSLVYPASERLDPHVWSWRRLGDLFGVHNETAKSRHATAIDLMVSRLNRGQMPAACVSTLVRIRAFNRAKEAPRPEGAPLG